ncbi:hypothetical protein D9M70_460120 [compost metagenome]
MNAVDREPRRVLHTLVDRLPARDQVGVNRLDALAGNEAQRRVARGGDEVEAAFVHQCHHFVRGGGRLDRDLASGLLFEIRDPVVVLVGVAALDVAGPGDDGEFAFTLAEFLQRLLRECRGNKAKRQGQCRAGFKHLLHLNSPSFEPHFTASFPE